MNTSRQVTVVGRVVRVRRNSGGWRVRLTDTGGTLAAAEIRHFSRVQLHPWEHGSSFMAGSATTINTYCTVDPVEPGGKRRNRKADGQHGPAVLRAHAGRLVTYA